MLRFILLLKNLCVLKYGNFFEKNSHLNMSTVEVPTFLHGVIRLVQTFYTWNPSKVQLPNLSQQVCSSKGKYLKVAKFSELQ
jgi:hypothetical protein